MERMGLTYAQAMNEPRFIIERAFIMWDLDNKRAKLKSGSNN